MTSAVYWQQLCHRLSRGFVERLSLAILFAVSGSAATSLLFDTSRSTRGQDARWVLMRWLENWEFPEG